MAASEGDERERGGRAAAVERRWQPTRGSDAVVGQESRGRGGRSWSRRAGRSVGGGGWRRARGTSCGVWIFAAESSCKKSQALDIGDRGSRAVQTASNSKVSAASVRLDGGHRRRARAHVRAAPRHTNAGPSTTHPTHHRNFFRRVSAVRGRRPRVPDTHLLHHTPEHAPKIAHTPHPTLFRPSRPAPNVAARPARSHPLTAPRTPSRRTTKQSCRSS